MRAKPVRRVSRRFQPTIGNGERLESRELLHSGSIGGVASAFVSAKPPLPAPATVRLQHAISVSQAGSTTTLQTINTPDATILVPSGLVPGRTYPLVVAFAFNGNPKIPFQVWITQAQQNQWIVYASKDFKNATLRNGLASSNAVAAKVKGQIDALSSTLPVDRSRIIFTGMSGAANYAEFMNLRYPGYAAGLIINSGRIPDQLFRKTPTPGFLTMPTSSEFDGSRRVGVFLASPTDHEFYGITKSNSRTMTALGWDILFLNFVGGHWNAPTPTYNQAIAWILSQPSWTAKP